MSFITKWYQSENYFIPFNGCGAQCSVNTVRPFWPIKWIIIIFVCVDQSQTISNFTWMNHLTGQISYGEFSETIRALSRHYFANWKRKEKKLTQSKHRSMTEEFGSKQEPWIKRKRQITSATDKNERCKVKPFTSGWQSNQSCRKNQYWLIFDRWN